MYNVILVPISVFLVPCIELYNTGWFYISLLFCSQHLHRPPRSGEAFGPTHCCCLSHQVSPLPPINVSSSTRWQCCFQQHSRNRWRGRGRKWRVGKQQTGEGVVNAFVWRTDALETYPCHAKECQWQWRRMSMRRMCRKTERHVGHSTCSAVDHNSIVALCCLSKSSIFTSYAVYCTSFTVTSFLDYEINTRCLVRRW